MNTITRIARKEFAAFFSSPAAFIFLGSFLAVNLFIFFWVETFFANNIAEMRGLFQWMPILLIFLIGAITMRLWSEERRAGTLEFLLTSPVKPLYLVLGKFLGCFGLVCTALVLTLPLPITVSFLGPLDWGPVFGGYLATLFLAAAYIAIGLFISVKSENQIVSLITTTIVCSIFYLIGSDTLTAFFGNKGAELLKLVGFGSRFESITRGVIDLRDLYYYLAIMGVFLSLNVYGLEKIRWAGNPINANHRRWKLVCGLLIANFLAANFWLSPINTLRTDLTSGKIYSISEATKAYLGQLKEPLLIRGYFSPQTHPLLAPLVPRIRDLLKEYAVAGGPRVRVEFVDPLENPELEQEAGQRYGIRPVPFQTASKYQSSVTNSYFNILIQYGDQFETLGFRDLIEVKSRGEQDLEVDLRNPEYDITRAIKKVLYSYQGGGDLFSNLPKDITFTGYISPDGKLPEELVDLKSQLQTILEDFKRQSKGTFRSEIVDPDANNGAVAKKISSEYGFRPMAVSLFDTRSFWFYMNLASGDQVNEVPLPEDLSAESLRRSLEAGLKRFAAGFTKTIALQTPKGTPAAPQYGIPGRGKQFNLLKDVLAEEHTVKETDLESGRVPDEADLLMVVSPEKLNEKQLFAVDQFLMQGGTVIMTTSSYDIGLEGALSANRFDSGLQDWLSFNGLNIEDSMVLDPQNSSFPVPVERNVGGFSIQETHLVKYPYFVDIRPDGMDQDSGILSGLNQVTMNWSSPISVDQKKNEGRKIIRLLESSEDSWSSARTNIQPDFKQYPDLGFEIDGDQGRRLLAVSVEGSFQSYFTGKPSPLMKKEEEKTETESPPEEAETKNDATVITRQIDKSPDTARIILFASNNFVNDITLGIGSSMMGTAYLMPVQMLANSVDYALEDRGLLEMRGRSHFARTLIPMTKRSQLFWEYLNYALAFIGLCFVWALKNVIKKRTQSRYSGLVQQSTGRI